MALKPSLSNLEVRVSALEILVYKMIESLAVAKVAEKTADKALAMAQEALVIITSAKAQEPQDNTEDPFADAELPTEEATPDVSVRALRGLMAKRANQAKEEEIGDDEQINKIIEAEDAAAEANALSITTE